jgi:hypothetical protein
MIAAATLGATLLRAIVAHTKPALNEDTKPRIKRQLIIVSVEFIDASSAV